MSDILKDMREFAHDVARDWNYKREVLYPKISDLVNDIANNRGDDEGLWSKVYYRMNGLYKEQGGNMMWIMGAAMFLLAAQAVAVVATTAAAPWIMLLAVPCLLGSIATLAHSAKRIANQCAIDSCSSLLQERAERASPRYNFLCKDYNINAARQQKKFDALVKRVQSVCPAPAAT